MNISIGWNFHFSSVGGSKPPSHSSCPLAILMAKTNSIHFGIYTEYTNQGQLKKNDCDCSINMTIIFQIPTTIRWLQPFSMTVMSKICNFYVKHQYSLILKHIVHQSQFYCFYQKDYVNWIKFTWQTYTHTTVLRRTWILCTRQTYSKQIMQTDLTVNI